MFAKKIMFFFHYSLSLTSHPFQQKHLIDTPTNDLAPRDNKQLIPHGRDGWQSAQTRIIKGFWHQWHGNAYDLFCFTTRTRVWEKEMVLMFMGRVSCQMIEALRMSWLMNARSPETQIADFFDGLQKPINPLLVCYKLHKKMCKILTVGKIKSSVSEDPTVLSQDVSRKENWSGVFG